MIQFEHKSEPLLPLRRFWSRLAVSALLAAAMVLVSLAIGVAGYHWLAGLGWIDSFLNASMILTGMGPVDRMDTDAAKVFASTYAIFSGVAFLTSIGFLIAPAFHRFLHHFHIEEEDSQ